MRGRHYPGIRGRHAPESAVEQLLAADRGFATAAQATDLITGLTAMIDIDAVIPAPQAQFARGPVGMGTMLRTNTKNTGSRITWSPVRGAISADGTRGFTFGHATVTRGDGTVEFNKYLSYWIKRTDGWRVLAYQRVRRPAAPVATAILDPILSGRMERSSVNGRRVKADRRSLAAAEKAFSDLAQRVGLGPAFGMVGTDDAVLISIGNDFVIGAERIAKEGFDASTTSAVSWASDGTDVAPSGDLGLSGRAAERNRKVL